MEEQETLVTVPPCPTYKDFQHGKHSPVNFILKSPVEKPLYAISHNHSAAQKGTKITKAVAFITKTHVDYFFLKIEKHVVITHYCQSPCSEVQNDSFVLWLLFM